MTIQTQHRRADAGKVRDPELSGMALILTLAALAVLVALFM